MTYMSQNCYNALVTDKKPQGAEKIEHKHIGESPVTVCVVASRPGCHCLHSHLLGVVLFVVSIHFSKLQCYLNNIDLDRKL